MSTPTAGLRPQLPTRTAPRLGRPLTVVGLGCWQIGGDWGTVTDDAARAVLDTAWAGGIDYFDTADVYGDGRSEALVGGLRDRVLAADPRAPLLVSTKIGRRAHPFDLSAYTPEALRGWVERSRRLLGTDTLDLVQLHCPPPAVYTADHVFDALDDMVARGWLARYGVSVETCDEALTAMRRDAVASVQIILNPLRLKPLEEVLPTAARLGVAIIARVPLASGLLSGRLTRETTFAPDDHRSFNRHGEAFDQGETFSGVDYETGLRAVAELSDAVAGRLPLAEAALRWILGQEGVTTTIPGARRAEHVAANTRAALPGDDAVAAAMADFAAAVGETYDRHLRAAIHPRW